ncbi:lysozyme inhibitor LprI family protein [Xanthomonas prunicola]|uniref:lysozyme inhibitor LprI family protein n=1 Tax=Xanthomonas prunicola TaxID=2053930 RepID=UPI0021B2E1FA|nr:lysozyme inhibitor LprI family protein [Xanthomonas prunicola]UXA55088.1 lysozyme inhibitor LprI family protein [Xanthomonas prunicola]
MACQKQARGAIEHAACVSQEETVQDRRLNKAYKQLLTSLKADGRAKLVDAQRAWLLSRTKDGNLEAVIYGDSQPENIESAEAAMLRLSARADQLEKYLALIN